jgi:septum formation protein
MSGTYYPELMTQLILASQSPARLKILKDAGFDPIVQTSDVDEDQVLSSKDARDPEQYVQTLAEAKAQDVAQKHALEQVLVLGADSALSFDGEILGKPLVDEIATQSWKQMRGKQGTLFTGQTLVDTKNQHFLTKVSATKVWFSNISDLQIERYVDSKEPLMVAGAFTIDSLGGAFIDRIEGDYHTVVGLSLRLLREMMAEMEYEYTDFWN